RLGFGSRSGEGKSEWPVAAGNAGDLCLRVPGRANQLVQQIHMSLLRGNELVEHELGAGSVDVIDSAPVILQTVLFPFLEGFEAGAVTEEIGGALRELRPDAPRAGRIAGLATELADAIAQRLSRPTVVGLSAA